VHQEQNPTVLIVRGAGPAGRRIATTVADAGGTPVVLDERTCAHDGVQALRVPFENATPPRRAVHDLVRRRGGLDAMVLLPMATWTAGATEGSSWEHELGHELTLMAGLVRSAAPALAASVGVVIPVSAPPEHHDPTHPVALSSRICDAAIHALADEYGFRVAPVVTVSTGTSRGTVVAAALAEQWRGPSTSMADSRGAGGAAGRVTG
jgi:nucleoside-diphosphate-sugar epimerase